MAPSAARIEHHFERRTWPSAVSLWVCAALLFGLSVLLAPLGSLADGQSASDPGQVADLAALERAFQQVVRRVSPSVVGIRARRRYVTAVPSADASGDISTVEQLAVINGSGTVIRADGSILTNEHVIQGANEIEVIGDDGQVWPATVLGADARSDLAIVRIDAQGLTPAKLCAWDDVARGQWSIVLGNPFGLGGDGQLSVSVGVISNLDRRLPGLGEVDDRLYADMIQTTAPIHPGNSGGPVFNIRGEVIGVVTAVHTRGVEDEGVGFAIPMTPGRQRVIQQLLEGQHVEYGYLGLTVRALTPEERKLAGLEAGVGVLAEKVDPEGPADAAGVKVGDIVTGYADHPVSSPMRLADLVGQTPVGREVVLTLRRSGRALTLRAVIDVRQVNRVGWMRGGAVIWRGVRLTDLTVDSRARMDVAPAVAGVVVIDLAAGSAAERAGLRIGDVIERVEGEAVGDISTFLQAVRGRHGSVRLGVRGRGPASVLP